MQTMNILACSVRLTYPAFIYMPGYLLMNNITHRELCILTYIINKNNASKDWIPLISMRQFLNWYFLLIDEASWCQLTKVYPTKYHMMLAIRLLF